MSRHDLAVVLPSDPPRLNAKAAAELLAILLDALREVQSTQPEAA